MGLQGFVYRAGVYGLGYYRDDAAEDADKTAAAALLREFEAVRAGRGGALMLANPLLNGVATGTAPRAVVATAVAADSDTTMATGADDHPRDDLDPTICGGGNGGGRYLNQYTITLRTRVSPATASAKGAGAALGVRPLLASPRHGEPGVSVANLLAVDAHGVVGVHGVFAGAASVAMRGRLMCNTLTSSGAVAAQSSGDRDNDDLDPDTDHNSGGWHDVTLSVKILPAAATVFGGGAADDATDKDGGVTTAAAFATTYVNGTVHTRLQLRNGTDAARLLSTLDGPLALGDRLAIFGASGSTASVADMCEATLIARSMNDREVYDAAAAARCARATKHSATAAASSLSSGTSARNIDTLHDRASTPEAAVERALARVGHGRRSALTAAARHIVVATLKEVRVAAACASLDALSLSLSRRRGVVESIYFNIILR